ncbi:hypothetical protein ACFXPN_44525 [Streptomyces griseorubiginosus]|uniref:hypothetical protein n=1 Tax=Streptomyces griseorubiginosus TaxID=67304 RepID=UPI0036C83104
MTKKLSTNGFSVVEVVVVLFVVAALGVGGFFVWQKTHDKNKTSDTKTQTTDQKTDTNTDENTEPADPSEGGKYLVIKEWGVRFPLPEQLRGDVDYSLNEKVLDEFGIERMDFTSKSLTSSALKCDYVDSDPKVVAYMLRQENQPGEDNTLQPFKHLDGYYYTTGSQCTDYLTDETQPLLNNFTSSFNQAVKSLEAYDAKN